MVQLAKDLQQALSVFFQINALMEARGVQNDFVDRPVVSSDGTIGDMIHVTIRGGHKHEELSTLIQWSCGIFLDEGPVSETDDINETYRAFVEVELLKCDEGIHHTSIFEIRYEVGTGDIAWTLEYPSLGELTLIDELGSLELKERWLAADADHLDHQFALDLISMVLPLVGASRDSRDSPAPVTLPSPGSEVSQKE